MSFKFSPSSRAWDTMSLKILDWTAWTYIKSIFFGRYFNVAVGGRLSVVGETWQSLLIKSIASLKFLFMIAFPILMFP